MFYWLASNITSWISTFFDLIRSFGDSGIALMKAAAIAAMPSTSGTWTALKLDQANLFFPLSETVSYMAIYLSFWALVFSYRIIKSWIPTVAS